MHWLTITVAGLNTPVFTLRCAKAQITAEHLHANAARTSPDQSLPDALCVNSYAGTKLVFNV